MKTKVMKFGGSSVANTLRINRVIDIVLQASKKKEKIILVVSALGGITDDLIMLATLASKPTRTNGNTNTEEEKSEIIFNDIHNRHNHIVKESIRPHDQERVLI